MSRKGKSGGAFKKTMGKGVKALADLVAARKVTDKAIEELKERLEQIGQARNAEWAKMLNLYRLRIRMSKFC